MNGVIQHSSNSTTISAGNHYLVTVSRTSRHARKTLERLVKATLQLFRSIGSLYCFMIFAPTIVLTWTAVGLHRILGMRHSGCKTSVFDKTARDSWIYEMEDFDRF